MGGMISCVALIHRKSYRYVLTEMASLVQVSIMGWSKLSNSVMSNCVSSSSFWVCCSIAKVMAAVTCSYIGKALENLLVNTGLVMSPQPLVSHPPKPRPPSPRPPRGPESVTECLCFRLLIFFSSFFSGYILEFSGFAFMTSLCFTPLV